MPGVSVAIPDVVAVALEDQEDDGAERREGQVRQAGLVVEPQAEAGVELADLGGGKRARHVRRGSGPGPGPGTACPPAGLAIEASPGALGLRVLERRRAPGGGGGGGGDGRGKGASAGVVGGPRRRQLGRRDARVLGGRRLVGGEVHGGRRRSRRWHSIGEERRRSRSLSRGSRARLCGRVGRERSLC